MSDDVSQWSDAGVKALQQTTAEQVRSSVSQALAVNPDTEAQLRQQAQVAQVPMPAARAYPEETKVRAQMSQFDADMLARTFPRTAQLLTDPDVAKIAHDDIPRTTQVEQATNALTTKLPATPPPALLERAKTLDFWTGLAKYVFSANEGKDNLASDVSSAATSLSSKIGMGATLAAGGPAMLVDAATSAATGTTQTGAQDVVFGATAKYANSADAQAEAGKADAFHNKLVKSAATLGLQLPMMLATGGGGALPDAATAGTEALASFLGHAVVHGSKAMAVPALTDSMDMMRHVYEKTGDMNQAARAGMAQYAVSTAGGILPLNAPGGLAARLATGAVVGGVQGELSRQAMNQVLPGQMQAPFDPEELALSSVTGGLTAGLMGPQAPGNRAAAVRAFNDAYEAARAEHANEQVLALSKAAASSKLRERDPAAFKQFVKDTADAGDTPSALYIDAGELQKVLAAHDITADELHQTMPEVAEQLAANGDMAPTNALVKIPLEDYATHIAGSDLDEQLLEHLRTAPEGATIAESKAYKKTQSDELLRQATKLTEKNAGDAAYQDSLNRVVTDLHQRLTGIGMHPEIAAANAAPLAAFYQVQADRYGVLPHEMAARLPVHFGNKALEGDLLKQGDLIDLGDLGGLQNNGSGESSASLEAQSRVAREKANDQARYLIDTRSNTVTPLTGVDAVDKHAGAGQIVVQKNVGAGQWSVLSSGGDVSRGAINGAIARGQAAGTLQQSMSTRVPTTKKNPDNALGDRPLLADLESMATEPEKLAQNVKLLGQYPGLKLKGTVQQKLEQFVEHVKNNLLFLHDSVDPDTRERSKLWYDGARRIVDQWAPHYGISDAQMSGMLAVLSPQKDWFMNVSLAKRVADTMHDQHGTRWDDGMTETSARIFAKDQYAADVAAIKGKTLGEITDPVQKAMWVRAFDETHNDRGHSIVSPEGELTGPRTNANGSPTKTGWGSLGEIAKAISVYEDGSPENISAQLGGMHKVRNFYNNIFDPNSAHGYATIDTHAVAAGLLRPLSGSSPEVLHNFGSNEKGQPGPAASAKTGLSGTYAIFHEAYKRAAAERGLLPREMQSITWEAVRGLFKDTFKSQKGNLDAIDKIWSEFKSGKLTLDEARAAVVERAGGIADPEWLGSGAGAHEADGHAADAGGVPAVQLPGRSAEPATSGDRGQPAGGAEGLDRFAGESPAFQQESRGTFSPTTKTITQLKSANLSTFQHELGHFFLDSLAHLAAQHDAPPAIKADMAALLKWFDVPDLDSWHRMTLDEQRESHEKFATGWETYLMKGEAPNLEMRSLFQRFRSWMLNVYKSLKGAPGDYTPEVKGVFDRMIASEDAIAQAEHARRYMALFDTPDQAGMSPDEWTAYQALGNDATEKAVEALTGKTLKDMAWMDRLRTASLKAVTKEAREKRAAIANEVKAEVMGAPIYRAWSFLTGKDSSKLPGSVDAAHKAAVRDWSEQRTTHEAETRTSVKNALWKASDAASGDGLAKGRWLSKNRAAVETEVKRAMDAYDAEHPQPELPAYQRADATDPTSGAGKLNTEALRSAFGDEVVDKLYALKMTGKKGIEPGAVADMFGFPDAESFVKALLDAEPPESVVDGMTDQRMLERHGEIADPQALARTADELVHNEVRARFVATEFKALKKATGTPKEIAAAAKEAAGNAIDTRRIRDIQIGVYDAAETRSAKLAEQAMAKGDTAGAAAAKRDQILNMELARAARAAQEYVEKAIAYLKKFDSPTVRENIDLEYRDQIDALLDRADLRKGVTNTELNKREALQVFVERMAAAGFKPGIPDSLLDEAQRWHYKDMPLAAFKGLVDSIKSIEQLGRLKQTLRDGQETRAIGELAGEMADAAGQLPQREAESNRGLTRMSSAWIKSKAFGRSAQAAMLKMEQMFDWLDARNPNGVLNRVVFRRIAEAQAHENDLLERVKSDIDKLVAANLQDVTKERGKIYVAAGLIDGATGLPQRFTVKEMLMLAGNMGNESNAAKLAKGEKWDQAEVWAFLNENMTKAHWDFVAGMGRALESLWPEKLAMDRRLGNTSPEKIQPRPFTTPHGDYAGWYWPMIYDPARSQDVAERGARQGDAMFENIYSKANTDTGRMNTRNENYARPVLLDLDALPRVIKDEIHDVSHREAIIDADRFLSHSVVRKAIISALSQEHYDQIRPWLQSIANDGRLGTEGSRGMEFFNSIAREARMRATMVGLGLRLTTAVVHGTTAALESVSELGPRWMASGLRDFANPLQWAANKDFVFERSAEMRNRMNEVDRDVREHLRQIDLAMMDPTTGTTARGADYIRAHAYAFIGGLDMASALPTWMGAYKKALEATERGGLGMSEEDAVYFADKTVRNAHGGTGVKDLARVQRGNEFQKLFTMFYTFWNHNVNRIIDTSKLVLSSEHREMTKKANNWSTTQLASTIILRTLAYTIGTQAIHSLINPPKKGDDGEGWLKWAAKEMTAAAFAGIPIARDISAHFLTGRDYSVTPAASAVDAFGRSGQDAAAALTGKHLSDKWLKHSITTAGYALNMPTGQVGATAQFLWDLGAGKTHPTTTAEWWAGIAHGDIHAHH